LSKESKRETPVGSKAHLPSHWTLLPPSLLSSHRNFVQGKKTYPILEVLANFLHPFSNLRRRSTSKAQNICVDFFLTPMFARKQRSM
jgi:hypothetical protein